MHFKVKIQPKTIDLSLRLWGTTTQSVEILPAQIPCVEIYTPNANMADHSVGARDESNGSEASEALMFLFKMLLHKTLALSSICSVLFRCAYELLCF